MHWGQIMNAIQSPRVLSLHKLLSDLYGRPVPVQAAPKFEPSTLKVCSIAIYVDNQDEVVGMLVCSLAAAAYMGAALSLLPKSIADESSKKGILDEGLFENFREVANICTTLFSEHLRNRVRLKSVLPKAATFPAEYQGFLQTASRTDASIDVPSYGSGPISIRVGKGA
jgi:hypothetical protein